MKCNFKFVLLFISQIGLILCQECSLKGCKNQGILDPVSCSCICLRGYEGNDCSKQSDCKMLPNDSTECNSSFCFDEFLSSLCPKTCRCQEATPECACKNSLASYFVGNQCHCLCKIGFTGDDCSKLVEYMQVV